jgi:hypothetical protein
MTYAKSSFYIVEDDLLYIRKRNTLSDQQRIPKWTGLLRPIMLSYIVGMDNIFEFEESLIKTQKDNFYSFLLSGGWKFIDSDHIKVKNLPGLPTEKIDFTAIMWEVKDKLSSPLPSNLWSLVEQTDSQYEDNESTIILFTKNSKNPHLHPGYAQRSLVHYAYSNITTSYDIMRKINTKLKDSLKLPIKPNHNNPMQLIIGTAAYLIKKERGFLSNPIIDFSMENIGSGNPLWRVMGNCKPFIDLSEKKGFMQLFGDNQTPSDIHKSIRSLRKIISSDFGWHIGNLLDLHYDGIDSFIGTKEEKNFLLNPMNHLRKLEVYI